MEVNSNGLTKDTAVTWLQDKLQVTGIERRLKEDRLALINDIVCAFMRDIPFQTITLSSRVLEDRRVPTTSDIIENILKLKGGVCIDLNYFMRLLLESLGFEVDTLGGHYTADCKTPFSHIMTLVHGVEKTEDSYLVEVGCGYPTFYAISLDALPHTFTACGMEVRYIQDGEFYYRLHRKGDFVTDNMPPAIKEDGWRSVFHFDLKPRDLDFFTSSMKPFFIDGCFLEDMHLARFPGTPGDEMIALKDRTMYSYNSTSLGILKQPIEDSDLENIITSNFPNIDNCELVKSLKHYRAVWNTKNLGT